MSINIIPFFFCVCVSVNLTMPELVCVQKNDHFRPNSKKGLARNIGHSLWLCTHFLLKAKEGGDEHIGWRTI